MPPDADTAPQGRIRRSLDAFGAASPWIAAALLLHLVFVVARFPRGAIAKRVETVEAFASYGALWHFRDHDETTFRMAAWLVEAMPRDHALLYEGASRGVVEALAAAIFPATLVKAAALRPDGTAAGRPVFRGRPPWLPPASPDAPPGVLKCGRTELRWSER